MSRWPILIHWVLSKSLGGLAQSWWCALNHAAHSQEALPGFRALAGAGLFPGAALPHVLAAFLVKDGKEIRRLHGLPAVGHAQRQP